MYSLVQHFRIWCKPSDLYTLFQGTSSQGESKSVVIPSTRNTAIGFYLDPADNGLNSTDKFYSESALNNGNGQVAVFQNKSNADDYILAWEDLSLKNGCSAQNPMVYTSTAWTDGDYNDFIVQVKVVPEPVITSLFIVSILILICITFTQKKHSM
jgi:hypothetical protein